MKKANNTILNVAIVLLLLLCHPSWGEEGKKAPAYKGYIYWMGLGSAEEKQVSLDSFIQQMDQALSVRMGDSQSYPLTSFDLIYKEVGVYENENGKREIMSDVKTASFMGSSLDTLWLRSLDQRLAWGDTIFVDNAKYKVGEKQYLAHPLKLYFYRIQRQ